MVCEQLSKLYYCKFLPSYFIRRTYVKGTTYIVTFSIQKEHCLYCHLFMTQEGITSTKETFFHDF